MTVDEGRFELSIDGAPFVRQWWRTNRPSASGLEWVVNLYWETYFELIGGGPTVRMAATATYDVRGRPLSYDLVSDRIPLVRVVFTETAAEVTLSDGSNRVVPLPVRLTSCSTAT